MSQTKEQKKDENIDMILAIESLRDNNCLYEGPSTGPLDLATSSKMGRAAAVMNTASKVKKPIDAEAEAKEKKTRLKTMNVDFNLIYTSVQKDFMAFQSKHGEMIAKSAATADFDELAIEEFNLGIDTLRATIVKYGEQVITRFKDACVKYDLEPHTSPVFNKYRDAYNSLLDTVTNSYLDLDQEDVPKPLMTTVEEAEKIVIDSWEDYLDINGDNKRPLLVQKNPMDALVSGRKLDYTTQMDTTFFTPHGHGVLAQSRLLADAHIRLATLKDARSTAVNGMTSVIYEVGAGATGLEKMVLMRKQMQYTKVIMHCCCPIMDAADLNRESRINETHLDINWVDKTGGFKSKVVNACTHRVQDCKCLATYMHYFQHVHPFATHSAYYLDHRDWGMLSKTGKQIRTAMHIPRDQPVPCYDPEFVWTVEPKMGFVESLKEKWRVALGGTPKVQFIPTKAMGTTYTHVDPTPMVTRGGLHLSSLGDFAMDCVESISFGAGVLAGGAAVGAMAAMAVPMPTVLRPGLALVGAAAGVYATAKSIKQIVEMHHQADPPPDVFGNVRTVSVDPCRSVYAADGEGEAKVQDEVCHIYTIRPSKAAKLSANTTTESADVSKASLSFATAIALLDPEGKSQNANVATLLRRGLTTKSAVDTMRLAYGVAKNYVCPAKNPDTASHTKAKRKSQPTQHAWGRPFALTLITGAYYALKISIAIAGAHFVFMTVLTACLCYIRGEPSMTEKWLGGFKRGAQYMAAHFPSPGL